MPSLADVVRRHGQDYLARFGQAVLPRHARALWDIESCRTPALGGHLAECPACGSRHLLYHSCRNRACAACGRDRALAWIARQQQLLLPVPYFHVVFTLPSELGRLVRSHQKKLCSVLFRAAFDSLAALCADERHLGARVGALGVLHTWTRTLEYHPHVHLLVPGGGLRSDGSWRAVPARRKRFLVPVKALAEKFRGRFLSLARRALPGVHLPEVPRSKHWVVFAKPVVQGPELVLDYLGRYVQRTAISDSAILACTDHDVTFRYRDSRDGTSKVMTLLAVEFLRRFLQHVLPRGLHRVRAFGLLHPAHRVTLKRLQLMLGIAPEPAPQLAPKPLCPVCRRGELRRLHRLSATQCYDLAKRGVAALARAPPTAGAFTSPWLRCLHERTATPRLSFGCARRPSFVHQRTCARVRATSTAHSFSTSTLASLPALRILRIEHCPPRRLRRPAPRESAKQSPGSRACSTRALASARPSLTTLARLRRR